MHEDYNFFPFRQMPFPQGYQQQMVPGGMMQGGMMPGGMTQGGMAPGGFIPGTTAGTTSPGFMNPVGGSPTPQFYGSDTQQMQTPQQTTSPFEMAPGSPVEQGIEYTQGYLRTQIGKKVRVEFLLGTNTIQDRRGTLLQVGISYIILREEDTDDLLLCDIYSIKFVTIYK